MIVVSYTVEGVTKTVHFPNTKTGHVRSIKFLYQLSKDRISHPFFLHRDKIKRLQEKIKVLGSRSKARVRMEVELNSLIADRAEVLKILGFADEKPPLISVLITKQTA